MDLEYLPSPIISRTEDDNWKPNGDVHVSVTRKFGIFLIAQLAPIVNDLPQVLRDIAAFEFYRLADEWRRERNSISSADEEIFENSRPYQEIIGLGIAVVPTILRELLNEPPEPWFWALAAITRTNPVPLASRGHLRKTRDAWIAWGILNRHIG